jgi:hypothetical protein
MEISAMSDKLSTEMESLAQKIYASTSPDDDSRLTIADAIARHLNLPDCPCAWDKHPAPVAGAGVDEAARNLLAKLNKIEADSQYQSIWPFLHAHNFHYTGPSWNSEKAKLATALQVQP